MPTEAQHDPLAPGQPCLPANPIYFREALEATLPVLQAQMELEATGAVDWQTAQFQVMDTFMQAYDPEASESERYSALWRAMKLFELIQEAAADPNLSGPYLVTDVEVGCLRVHPILLEHLVNQPMVVGERVTWVGLNRGTR